MASVKSVEKQLKAIKFSSHSWGRAEIGELPGILLDDEKIFECVNGSYEGGFALLVATNIRLLLIDKKPLKFLTVEDLRFDMINQIDYSHRLMGARINVSAGSKNLKFFSVNQQRLRKLINHIQHRMAEVKTEQSSSADTQQQHLERINQQLQTYLLAQHQQQEDLRKQLEQSKQQGNAATLPSPAVEPVKPAPELADFLYAQSLMKQYEAATNTTTGPAINLADPVTPATSMPAPVRVEPVSLQPKPYEQQPTVNQQPTQPSLMAQVTTTKPKIDTDSLIEAGRLEVFGARARAAVKPLQTPFSYFNTEVNPLRIAYAKLPQALKYKKFRQAAPTANRPDQLPNNTQIAGVQ